MFHQRLFALRWVMLGMFVLGVGQSIEFAIMPMLGRALEIDKLVIDLPAWGIYYQPKELAITVLASVTALCFSIFTPFWGRLSDRLGRKPFIVFGLFGYALGMALFCLVAWLGLIQWLSGFALFLALFLARVVHSALKSAAYPSSNAYIIDSVSVAARTKALGSLAAATQIGSMLGPTLVFLVAISFLAPLLLQAIICLALAVIVMLSLPHTRPDESGLEQHRNKPLRYFDQRYRQYTLLCLLLYLAMGMVQQTLGFYFQDLLRLSTAEAASYFSLSLMVSSAAMLFAQLFVVQRFRFPPEYYIGFGLPVLMLSFLALALSSQLLHLMLALAGFGFAFGLIGPSLAAAASKSVLPQEQGGLSGIIASVSGLGFVIGPLIGGFLYSLTPQAPYFFSSVIVCTVIFVFIVKAYFFRKNACQ